MPYIKPSDRKRLEEKIKALADELLTIGNSGSVNYAVTLLLLKSMKPQNGWNYESLMRVIGTLECVKTEIYTQLISPYEELCVTKNGTIPELQDEALEFLTKALEIDLAAIEAEKRGENN